MEDGLYCSDTELAEMFQDLLRLGLGVPAAAASASAPPKSRSLGRRGDFNFEAGHR